MSETDSEKIVRKLVRQQTANTLALLGKQVAVRITDEHDSEQVIVCGQLLAIGDHGSFVVRDICGEVHYCWPLLDITEVTE